MQKKQMPEYIFFEKKSRYRLIRCMSSDRRLQKNGDFSPIIPAAFDYKNLEKYKKEPLLNR